jgi:predicted  nucleic acid-binding Zn-ribbon protein
MPKAYRPSREELEHELRHLRTCMGNRTPVEQQATKVDQCRMEVDTLRNQVCALEAELVKVRSRLSSEMLTHMEETTKLKDMTSLSHQVP